MTSLTLVRRIRARPGIVFQAMTSPEGIAHWWGPDAGLDGTEHESTGEYLEIVESKRLVMSWQWTAGGAAEEAGEVSRIEIDLKATDSGTEITFTHARLRNAASKASHGRGWAGALDKLVRHFSSNKEVET
jgi:uncharacterized protein YndB with AHSA1/START domain